MSWSSRLPLSARGDTFRSHHRCSLVAKGDAMSNHSKMSSSMSAEAKDELNRLTESHGSAETRNPACLVLDDEVFDQIAESIKTPAPPTDALRELMRGQRL